MMDGQRVPGAAMRHVHMCLPCPRGGEDRSYYLPSSLHIPTRFCYRTFCPADPCAHPPSCPHICCRSLLCLAAIHTWTTVP